MGTSVEAYRNYWTVIHLSHGGNTGSNPVGDAKLNPIIGAGMDQTYHLAQINIARFRRPISDPVNADFVANLDRVNRLADTSPGFLWRLMGNGGSATDIQAFDDPNIIVNMSLWTGLEALAAFTYKNPAHLEIMRRRKEWFEKMELYMTLWWLPIGHRPTISEAKERLEMLRRHGPTADAFTFSHPFGAPGTGAQAPITDRCA
ncbi:MAG TPA: DUF3291 domain-containing protein [Stellaceae bacterium]|nr:DUF3291 domain-containing protein [Stellaceae bacterium]